MGLLCWAFNWMFSLRANHTFIRSILLSASQIAMAWPEPVALSDITFRDPRSGNELKDLLDPRTTTAIIEGLLSGEIECYIGQRRIGMHDPTVIHNSYSDLAWPHLASPHSPLVSSSTSTLQHM